MLFRNIFILLIFLTFSNAANLLIISPSLSRSLLSQMGRLADLFVHAGHNVTVWIPEMQPLPENGTNLAQRVLRMSGLPNPMANILGVDVFGEEIDSLARLAMDDAMVEFCEAILMRKNELEKLREFNFDLAFTNMIDVCMPGLVHFLGIPRHIWISTGPMADAYYWLLGNPHPLSILPTLQETFPLGPKMTTWERALNVWQYSLSWFCFARRFWKQNALFRRHISPNFPALEEITSNTDLAFVNVEEFLEPAIPMLPKIIPIGGLGLRLGTSGKLSQDIQNALDSGKKGFVLVSVGSITSTQLLNPVKWRNLLAAFGEFPEFAFLVKVSPGDAFSWEVTGKMANVHLFEWFPQIDLLAHPNIRLLISHAGYNSLLEAAIHGVPILTIPLFFDQLRNAKCAEHRGHTRVLLKRELLSPEKIREEIGEMLKNLSYKKAAQRLSKLYLEKPNRPEHSVLSWTQFVLSNGPLVEMRPESVGMSVVEYFCVDIAICVGIVSMALIWLTWRAISVLLRFFICRRKSKFE